MPQYLWDESHGNRQKNFMLFICALERKIFYTRSDWALVTKSNSARFMQRWTFSIKRLCNWLLIYWREELSQCWVKVNVTPIAWISWIVGKSWDSIVGLQSHWVVQLPPPPFTPFPTCLFPSSPSVLSDAFTPTCHDPFLPQPLI